MLFNSYGFIFLFLPLTFFGAFWLGRNSHRTALLWLAMASLTFYALWNGRFLLLLLASIAFNFGAARLIELRLSNRQAGAARFIFFAAVSTNLGLLGYFKYANFFIDTLNQASGSNWALPDLILPLGISFFTFTQIAFLVDVYRGVAHEAKFLHYLLFVTWFPHLVAGPILHHKQMMPQFARPEASRINVKHVAVGLTIFVLGLAKKVLVADNLADCANPVFAAASNGQVLRLFEAWSGALAYTLQLYFDFSGYSDMAVGLSLMFNIRLPMNFDSPYQATSMIDFWRRWHMTLSEFLRDYLYIPLGGNRTGKVRRYANLMATMLLGGLWHGAGWTFIVWGCLHGIYLTINHGWRRIKRVFGWEGNGKVSRLFSGGITFIAVVVAWVLFRADSLDSAKVILMAMAGLNGISLPAFLHASLSPVVANLTGLDISNIYATELVGKRALRMVLFGLILVWFFPNVRQIMRDYRPTWNEWVGRQAPAGNPCGRWSSLLTWHPVTGWALATTLLFFLSFTSLTQVSEFLYFQF